MNRWWWLAAIACFSNAYAVNRCTRPGGEVVFQDAPCSAGDQVRRVDVRPATGHSDPLSDVEAVRRNAISAAIVRGEPLNTMTLAELERAMGLPNKINSANYGQGVEEQRIYYRSEATWMVYTEKGRVRSIQRTEAQAIVSAPQAPPQKVCPTKKEIWDLEIKASSIAVRGTWLQRDLELRLADMRACK